MHKVFKENQGHLQELKAKEKNWAIFFSYTATLGAEFDLLMKLITLGLLACSACSVGVCE